MVTGVEIAGLVVGSLPLLFSLLEQYSNGINTMRSLGDREYRRTLRYYLAHLGGQKAQLLDILSVLMEDTMDVDYAVLSREDALEFLAKPDIQARLRKRLGHRYDAFRANREALEDSVQKILPLIPKIDDQKLSWVRLQLKKTRGIVDKAALQELLERAQSLTSTLESLSHNASKEESRMKKRSFSGNVSQYHRVRKHARSLYRALSHDLCWQCTKERGHVHQLSMKLQTDIGSRVLSKAKDSGPKFILTLWSKELMDEREPPPRWLGDEFRIEPWDEPRIDETLDDYQFSAKNHLIPFRPKGDEVKSKKQGVSFVTATAPLNAIPWKKPSPSPPGPHLYDICHSRKGKGTLDSSYGDLKCDGVLRDSEVTRERLYEIFHARQIEDQPSSVSLRDLIEAAAAEPEWKAGTDSLRLKINCLRLACIISTNTLHFQGYWFNPFWETRDIAMISETSIPGGPMQPYITQDIPLIKERPRIPRHDSIRSMSLLSLGFCLVELAFCQPMSVLQEPGDQDADPIMAKYKTSLRLLGRIDKIQGGRYGDVVSKCLTWPGNGMDDMDDYDVQRSVFELIIQPLLEDFSWQATKNF